jgi:hypothetical protein
MTNRIRYKVVIRDGSSLEKAEVFEERTEALSFIRTESQKAINGTEYRMVEIKEKLLKSFKLETVITRNLKENVVRAQ